MHQKAAILFPGGGSHYTGMAEKLLARQPEARLLFDRAAEFLGYDLLKLCQEGPAEKLAEMEFSQPAIFVTDVAWYEYFRERFGWYPAFMSGHSLGEYAALVCSGTLSFEDGLRLVQCRGEVLGKAGSELSLGMMAVRGICQEELMALVSASAGDAVHIAVENGTESFVLSGTKKALAKAASELYFEGIDCTLLDIPTASHSPYLNDYSHPLRELVKSLTLHPSTCPVVFNIDASSGPRDRTAFDRLTVEHLLRPVKWQESIRTMLDHGVTVFIEAGPGNILSRMGNENYPDARFFAMDSETDLEAMELAAHSVTCSPAGLMRACLRSAVTMPGTGETTATEPGVVESMTELHDMRMQFTENGIKALAGKEERMLELLQLALKGKGLGQSEIGEELYRIRNASSVKTAM